MSTITNSSQTPSLASTLLQLTSQTQPANLAGSGAEETSDLADTLNLSNSSVADLEQQAQEIASQNLSSALTTSEQAFSANLAAVAALSGNPAQAQSAQGSQDSSSVLSLVSDL
ncbi:MAG: hypothetical protein ACREFX_11930 [Opitutaceae bacterium]